MERPGILFVCSQLGARSAIAAAFASRLLGDEIPVTAACFQSGTFGPMISKIMDEVGLKVSLDSPPTVFQQYTEDTEFEYVVFLCNSAIVDMCQLFQSDVDRLFTEGETLVKWAVPPFSDLQGTPEEKLEGARTIRDGIENNVKQLVEQIRAGEVQNTFNWQCATD